MPHTAIYLRDNTRTEHQRTEATMGADHIKNGSFSKAGYITLLAANHRIWSGIGSWLMSHPEPATIAPDIDFVHKMTKALEQDLLLLGTHPATDPWQVDIPSEDNASRLGMMYVLRGSTLGGRMIARMLPSSPELTATSAFNFYSACGEQEAGHWKQFTSLLNDEVRDASDRQRCLVASKHVFNTLEHSMRDLTPS